MAIYKNKNEKVYAYIPLSTGRQRTTTKQGDKDGWGRGAKNTERIAKNHDGKRLTTLKTNTSLYRPSPLNTEDCHEEQLLNA